MASESEKWAAVELQHWLKEITGAELPVQDINDTYSGPQIIIGYNTDEEKNRSCTHPQNQMNHSVISVQAPTYAFMAEVSAVPCMV